MYLRRAAALGAATALTLLAGALPASAAGGSNRTVYAVTSTGNRLLTFTANNPQGASGAKVITGTAPGERVVGIDIRPATQQLYGVTIDGSGNGRLYTIDKNTAAATLVPTNPAVIPLNGQDFDTDVNPCSDALRIVSDTGQNLRIPFSTGQVNTDTTLAYASSDPNAGKNPDIGGAAYTPGNSSSGTCTTTLYDADFTLNNLVVQNPANAGTLTTRGPFGQDVTNLLGFDIDPDGIAYLASQVITNGRVGQSATFYTVDLATGKLSQVGSVGEDIIDSIAVDQTPTAPGTTVPEFPLVALAPIAALGVGGVVLLRRRNALA